MIINCNGNYFFCIFLPNYKIIKMFVYCLWFLNYGQNLQQKKDHHLNLPLQFHGACSMQASQICAEVPAIKNIGILLISTTKGTYNCFFLTLFFSFQNFINHTVCFCFLRSHPVISITIFPNFLIRFS